VLYATVFQRFALFASHLLGHATTMAPTSTYRLQITADFPLASAAEVVDYLAELGVGAVYVSPLLTSTHGSQHGYDVTDHTSVDRDRGGLAGLEALAAACMRAGLQLVVDIVPNHMGIEDPSQNRAWWDVLKRGLAADHASWFDIEWTANGGRIVVPVLADDADLERDLTILGEHGEPELRYFEHRYPIAPGTYADGDKPTDVHAKQHYELVNFRKADTELNYRRFFAVTTLAALRVEDEKVFAATHAEILRWIADYGVAGLRVDHPDGLRDPGGYLEQLAAAAPGAWITVEKITEPGEQLPPVWPVAGMTGYDALAEVNAVFVDPSAEKALTRIYRKLTGDDQTWQDHILAGKTMMVSGLLRSEISRLARLVPDIDDAAPGLEALVAAFPVYRSYLPLGAEYLADAAQKARAQHPELDHTIAALLVPLNSPADELAVRFQQVTGAVMAKGVEDTAYYRYTRFIGLNEVGGNPGQFGSSIADFHAAQKRRQHDAPAGMTTLSTHDTKRSEDIRARLAVLAEIADEWGATARELLHVAPIDDRAFGYLLWQTLAATGPIDRARIHNYAEKAMREAARATGWIDQDDAFESSVHAAVDAANDVEAVRVLLAALGARIAAPSRSNSLSQKLVQLTMPGVPDVYQGTELWDDSLVDPDNRRPVDFSRRATRLRALFAPERALESVELLDDDDTKLWVVANALRARRDRPELFTGYEPLLAEGPAADHLIGFDRGGAITLATRLPVALSAAGGWAGEWANTSVRIPDGQYLDVLTGTTVVGGAVALCDVFADLPVALLLATPNA
jgi:(1->4)-alpha-D-glucan 1-alpha-D-glucosylmutase